MFKRTKYVGSLVVVASLLTGLVGFMAPSANAAKDEMGLGAREQYNQLSDEAKQKLTDIFYMSFEDEAKGTLDFWEYTPSQESTPRLGAREQYNQLSDEAKQKLADIFHISFEDEAKGTLDFW